ncbi:MAG: hypothetical protein QME51_05930, partial [Planctomycetota bacterium]|nr:hypothetical protein [Planctomycetota bacterium]
ESIRDWSSNGAGTQRVHHVGTTFTRSVPSLSLTGWWLPKAFGTSGFVECAGQAIPNSLVRCSRNSRRMLTGDRF